MKIPIIEFYKGIGIHDFQNSERIQYIVKPAIDEVYTISDPARLFDYASDKHKPPEARLFAGDKYRATHEMSVAMHELRPGRLERLAAILAGLDSLDWADSRFYGTSLEPRPPGPETRPPRPAECIERLKEAREP